LQQELLDQWSQRFAEYRALLKTKLDESAAVQVRDDRLAELRTEMQQLDQLRQKQHRDETGLEAPKQHHARVWVFLRK
jgi:hypothetical protein